MSSLAIQFDPTVGPVLPVTIMTVNADGSPTQIVGHQNDMHVFNGLLDTGASRTCISARVVSNVALVPTGKIQIFGVTGTKAS